MRILVLLVGLAALAAAAVVARGHSSPASLPSPPPVPPPAHHVRRGEAPARPPQFVVASFDGSGGARLLGYWRAVAQRAHAHFTFFVSGVYLVDWAHHDRYAPPERPRGESAIGFAPDQAWIAAMRRELALAYRDGNEIGTHYNGHFCGSDGVATWSAADWTQELQEFDRFLVEGAPKLPFGPQAIVGGRTPCLEGNLGVLYPVLARQGFRYDASGQALLGTWPVKRDGIWSFTLPELPFVGMDYNFMANQVDESPAQIESETYRTLWNAFLASYHRNRAPLSLGSHFETWESWAYDHALTRFLLRACRLPAVRCTTYETLAAWLDGLPPKALRRYRA
jgi:hypothetical protein